LLTRGPTVDPELRLTVAQSLSEGNTYT